MNAMNDPELVAMARKIDLEIYPMNGEDLQDMVARVHKFSDAIIKKTQAIANSQ
jgi:sRNA-binding regulator protein Hfq